MGVTLAQVEELIAARKLICGNGDVVTEYHTDSDDELACPVCGFQFIDVPALIALAADLATPTQLGAQKVTFVIVEVSGRKIEDCKLLGDHPTAEDYSIYIR